MSNSSKNPNGVSGIFFAALRCGADYFEILDLWEVKSNAQFTS